MIDYLGSTPVTSVNLEQDTHTLNAYLARIRRADATGCLACGHPKEDVRHFLMDCPSYAHERWALYRYSKMWNPSLKTLLNEKKLIVPVANFIQATGKFEQGGVNRGQAEQDQTQEGKTQDGENGQRGVCVDT